MARAVAQVRSDATLLTRAEHRSNGMGLTGVAADLCTEVFSQEPSASCDPAGTCLLSRMICPDGIHPYGECVTAAKRRRTGKRDHKINAVCCTTAQHSPLALRQPKSADGSLRVVVESLQILDVLRTLGRDELTWVGIVLYAVALWGALGSRQRWQFTQIKTCNPSSTERE